MNGSERKIDWLTSALHVGLQVKEDGVVYLQQILAKGTAPGQAQSAWFKDSSLPLVEARLVGEGSYNWGKSSKALIGSYLSLRLKYVSHHEEAGSGCEKLLINTKDDESGVKVLTTMTIYDGVPVLRMRNKIVNGSGQAVYVTQLSSLVVGGLTTSVKEWWHSFNLSVPSNAWFREMMWNDHSLPSLGIDDNDVWKYPGGCPASWSTYSLSNHGSFSTSAYLPMGMLKRNDQGETWAWQVEHNGSWKWEIGDWKDSVYLAVGGPTHKDHHWLQKLEPNEDFETVEAAVCHVQGDENEALAVMNEYRRRIRRRHKDNETLPLIFNDYMNCLMGDPTEDKIAALIEPVVKAGAEYFVIDAGWYADDSGWWDDVGLWEPSKSRFPSGFDKTLEKLRSRGLIPGVWIEPEVIGVRSQMAKLLPEEAFFQNHGCRVIERGRFQLDFRHPKVIERLDSVIDRLVTQYGVGYFKFDYNIEVVQGTDVDSSSPGSGALGHNRAYLRWVNSLFDRYPDLVIENCSSGGQRIDYAMLSVHPLQSTSDQQDPVMYAAIAAAAFTGVTPEQSATWAYPQGKWSDEINALTVVNSLLGRVHLSGRLDIMSDKQLELINEGMLVYKDIRSDIKSGKPFWPLGLPKWHDDWLAVGLMCGTKVYLSVWRRGGSRTCRLPVKLGSDVSNVGTRLVYPSRFEGRARWDRDESAVFVTLPEATCARLFRLDVAV